VSRFLSVAEILLIHDQVLERWGGHHGVRDAPLLESALGAPQQTFDGEFLHVGALAQEAALLRSLAVNHPFVDGNKRTAFLAAVVFLELNGWILEVPDQEAIRFMFNLAGAKPSLESISAWLSAYSARRTSSPLAGG
jgi:death-on-curing protein